MKKINDIFTSYFELDVKSRGSKTDLNKAKKMAEKIGLEKAYVVSKDYVSEEGIISVVDL